MQEVFEWIPVEQKLPETDDYILVSFENFSVLDIGRYEANEDGGGAFYPGDEDKSYVEFGLFVNAWQPLPKPYRKMEQKEWVLIDCDFREKLPEEDCEIWITRVMFTGERWVQKVDYYADDKDIDWDGTIAWMVAEEGDTEPNPCEEACVMTIQNVR